MNKILNRANSIILALCFCFSAHAQTSQETEEVLYWTKAKRLNFTDFKGTPEYENIEKGSSAIKKSIHKLGAIVKSIDVTFVTEQTKTTFKIYAGMKKNLSWIKEEGDSISLHHEQGHFDICEIYARILRRNIKNVTSLSEAKEMYDKVSADEEAEQDQYDKENTFSNGGITPAWKEKIFNRLKELEIYENPNIVVSVNK